MAALAVLADVKRVGRITVDTHDASLAEALAVAELLVKKFLRHDPSKQTSTQTQKLYDIRSDAFIPLPVPGCVVSAVRVGDRTVGAATGYDVEETGIRLRTTGGLAVRPEERDTWQTFPRVEVDYTVPDERNVAIRDGTAFAALAIWKRGPSSGGGSLTTEKIGDYSYAEKVSDTEAEELMPDSAKALLRPWRRRPIMVP